MIGGDDDKKEIETSAEPDPDITAPDVEYLINTYDPGKDDTLDIINEEKGNK